MSKREKVAVVDRDNTVVGYQYRDELGESHIWRIICVWIENNKGEVLLQQRSLKKKLGAGKWTCAVEGTVEVDDSYEDTAKREIEEEIGLNDFQLVLAKRLYYKASYGERIAQGYKVICDWPLAKFTPQAEEVETLAWVSREKVIKEIKAGNTKYPISAKIWLEMFELV